MTESGAPNAVVLDDYVDSEGITVPLLYDPEPEEELAPTVRRWVSLLYEAQQTIEQRNGEIAALRARVAELESRRSIWDELAMGIEEMEANNDGRAR